jgi:hypothetical protein
MNRRKAIWGMTVLTAAITGIYGGTEIYRQYHYIHDEPDLTVLDQNKGLISELADTIIPRTDTPGAKDAEVENYIIMIVKECSDVNTQNRFIEGLLELQRFSESKYGKKFELLNTQKREIILAVFEKKEAKMHGLAGKVQNRIFGKSFFTILKELSVQGYCTSEPGATLGLRYLDIPGSYNGCIPFVAGQKSWATN